MVRMMITISIRVLFFSVCFGLFLPKGESQHMPDQGILNTSAAQVRYSIPILLPGEEVKSYNSAKDAYPFAGANHLFPRDQSGTSSMDVVAADLNGDGYEELIIATEFGPNLIFLNNGSSFEAGPALPEFASYQAPYLGEDSEDIALADFDQDGDPDLFFVSEDSKLHELLLNDGKGHFAKAPFQIPKTGDANAVVVYDFNQDGYPDVLIGHRGQNALHLNDTGKGFREATTTHWEINSDHTQDLILVDIDGDGDQDIVEAIESGGSNLYLNQNGQFQEASDRLPDLSAYEARKVIAVDVDQDGDQDLFFCHVGWQGTDPQNKMLLNDGSGHFTDVTSSALPKDQSTTLDAAFTDLNGDGLLDMVTTCLGSSPNLQVFVQRPEKDGVSFIRDETLFAPMNYNNGVGVLFGDWFKTGKRQWYFANHQHLDEMMTEK